MSGLFEFIAADDSDRRTASRKAVAVASKRCEQFFGFLAQAKTNEEYDVRAQVIAADVDEVIEATAEEFGVDPTHLASAIKQADLTYAARKPKMCPYHSEVVDVSLGAGDPQAGAIAMAQHAYTENSCRGGFEGKCNFKPEMVTQTFWDNRAEQAEQRKLERQQQFEQQTVQEEVPEPVAEEPVDNVVELHPTAPEPSAVGEGIPTETAEPQMAMAASHQAASETCNSCGGTGTTKSPIGSSDEENSCPKCDGTGKIDRSKTAEALKTVDVDAGSGSPEPKMDKRKWTPENVNFLDVEMDGSPHPTIHQDIVEPLDYNNDKDDGRFDQTDAVLEKQDVTQGSELSHSGQGGTWGKGNHDASPVTSASDARPKVVSFQTPTVTPAKRLPPGYQPNGEVDFQHPGYNADNYQICQNCQADHIDPSGHCPHCGHSQALQDGLDQLGDQLGQRLMPNHQGAAVDPDRNPIREMAKDDFPTEEELARAIDSFDKEAAYPPPYGSNEHDVMFGNQPPGGAPLPNISPLDGIHDELASRDGIHGPEPYPCEHCEHGSVLEGPGEVCHNCGLPPTPYTPPPAPPSSHDDGQDIPF